MPMWKKDRFMTWEQDLTSKLFAGSPSKILILSIPKDKDGLGARMGEVALQ